MLTSDFDFELPDELIAQYPLAQRAASRLLAVDASGEFSDHNFSDLMKWLRKGDLLVFNDTRVIPARLYGAKETGGKVEILIERITGEASALAHIRASKSPKPGSYIDLDNGHRLQVSGRQDALFKIELVSGNLMAVLEDVGHMPLPPYIDRADEEADGDRYQTVYARNPGAVAAPTAGLHFDDALLNSLSESGIDTGFVTLHVGAGTFQPVRVDDIDDHVMHEEYLQVSEALVEQIRLCRERGGRVVAVGTTTVRSLETAAQGGVLSAYAGLSSIFISPGYEFQVIDAMITNFHLPQSTLLMLVSAFIGHGVAMSAYRHAVEQRYRFFSYGDAMFLERAHHEI